MHSKHEAFDENTTLAPQRPRILRTVARIPRVDDGGQGSRLKALLRAPAE